MTRANCLAVLFLIITLLSSTTLFAVTNASIPKSDFDVWNENPKAFVNPVEAKIAEYQQAGCSDEAIITELAKEGYCWDPKSGATWKGGYVSAEDQAKMPGRSTGGNLALDSEGRTACMRTDYEYFDGVACEVNSGSMNLAEGETHTQYLCMQILENDASDWAEIVLTRWLSDSDKKWYVYEPDETGFRYICDKTTGEDFADCLVIMLDGNYNPSYGWSFDVWINYVWKYSGYLPSHYNCVGYQKEIYSDTGTFTDSSQFDLWHYLWTHDSQGWFGWIDGRQSTWWSDDSPVHEYHEMDSGYDSYILYTYTYN